MSMSQQGPCGQESQQYPGVSQEDCGQQVKGGDPDPLGVLSGIACSVLVSAFQETQGATGEDAVEATKTVCGLESLIQGETVGPGPV
ncbi:hypothetical protein HGM15179_003355 [Zosterops borbonicus]|uniref:Uncharacterized protein n=1 Tax=Zosterops borbonicus TaxID=364589 RepID=A0A8K1LR73_9PASS|nr:hypothetical protein HGM15179_003355 [Zosterops borbonicus]